MLTMICQAVITNDVTTIGVPDHVGAFIFQADWARKRLDFLHVSLTVLNRIRLHLFDL